LLRQAVPEPIARATEHRDVVRLQTDLLAKLAVQGRFRRLVAPHATLRELPAAAVASAAEKDFSVATHQYDADIRAEALIVDEIAH
jgi:hypothetical protein